MTRTQRRQRVRKRRKRDLNGRQHYMNWQAEDFWHWWMRHTSAQWAAKQVKLQTRAARLEAQIDARRVSTARQYGLRAIGWRKE